MTNNQPTPPESVGIIDVTAATHRIVDVLKAMTPRPDDALIAVAFVSARLCHVFDVDPESFVEQFWTLYDVEQHRDEADPS
jgi:hypothetical protein